MEEELEDQEGWKFLVPLHPLNDMKITRYFSYEPRFTGVWNNFPTMKDGAYVVIPDDENIKGTYWVLLFIDRNSTGYFDSFGIGYYSQEVLNKIKDKSITHNIFRIQDKEYITCGYCCIAFIECMLAGKTLLNYTNLFSPNDYKKNYKIIYKYFKDKLW